MNKKLTTVALVLVLAVSGCASTGGARDYSDSLYLGTTKKRAPDRCPFYFAILSGHKIPTAAQSQPDYAGTAGKQCIPADLRAAP